MFFKWFEGASLYYPSKVMGVTPKGVGLDYLEVQLNPSKDVEIMGWFVPYPKAKKTLLFLHGNAGNISNRLDSIMFFRRLGVNVFIIDYRGYGWSTGSPDEQGLYKDGRAAYDYLVNKHGVKPEDIYIFGESLGGAVAIDLAANVKAAGLITEGAFASTYEMAKAIYPFLPLKIIPITQKYDSISKISGVRMPKLFAHSPGDDIVPYAQSKMLFEQASEPKTFLELTGSHDSARFDSEEIYQKALKQFIFP